MIPDDEIDVVVPNEVELLEDGGGQLGDGQEPEILAALFRLRAVVVEPLGAVGAGIIARSAIIRAGFAAVPTGDQAEMGGLAGTDDVVSSGSVGQGNGAQELDVLQLALKRKIQIGQELGAHLGVIFAQKVEDGRDSVQKVLVFIEVSGAVHQIGLPREKFAGGNQQERVAAVSLHLVIGIKLGQIGRAENLDHLFTLLFWKFAIGACKRFAP